MQWSLFLHKSWMLISRLVQIFSWTPMYSPVSIGNSMTFMPGASQRSKHSLFQSYASRTHWFSQCINSLLLSSSEDSLEHGNSAWGLFTRSWIFFVAARKLALSFDASLTWRCSFKTASHSNCLSQSTAFIRSSHFIKAITSVIKRGEGRDCTLRTSVRL